MEGHNPFPFQQTLNQLDDSFGAKRRRSSRAILNSRRRYPSAAGGSCGAAVVGVACSAMQPANGVPTHELGREPHTA